MILEACLWMQINVFDDFYCSNGTLDLMIGDGPLLDYFRGTNPTCNLIDVSDHDKIGDDTYAVAMTRGFPLKVSLFLLWVSGWWERFGNLRVVAAG